MNADDLADGLTAFGMHARKLHTLLNSPSLSNAIGDGLAQEFRYAIAAFRARFPEAFLAPPEPPASNRSTPSAESLEAVQAPLAAMMFDAPTSHLSPREDHSMNYQQQVHGFTATGTERFVKFLYENGKDGLNFDAYRLNCLGTIEAALNDDAPLTWELLDVSSRDGNAHHFTVDLDDIIVETVETGASDDRIFSWTQVRS